MHWGSYYYQQNVIKDPLVRDAFDIVKREDFLPDDQKRFADEDRPIEIGFGQTNSQPYTVAFMLNLLDPHPGQRILDIGSGSGWTSTLLAYIVSGGSGRQERVYSRGKVFAVERIPELVKFGQDNAAKYNFVSSGVLKFFQSDGTVGLSAHAPYDRILVSAAFNTFPDQLLNQLKERAILVVPVGMFIGDVIQAVKHTEDKVTKNVFPGFSFVPMIKGQDRTI